jgi:hypothetical protein
MMCLSPDQHDVRLIDGRRVEKSVGQRNLGGPGKRPSKRQEDGELERSSAASFKSGNDYTDQ